MRREGNCNRLNMGLEAEEFACVNQEYYEGARCKNCPLVSSIRAFDTGASRSSEEGKLDPDGFLSHLAVMRYLEYMHQHRTMPDGTLRASDNWKQGIPIESYMKSLYRHFLDVWCYHSEGDLENEELEEALCAVIFNASGFLHELLKRRV